MNIGPEPTTDRFVALMYNKESLVIPGNALAVRADMPFTSFNKYGMFYLFVRLSVYVFPSKE